MVMAPTLVNGMALHHPSRVQIENGSSTRRTPARCRTRAVVVPVLPVAGQKRGGHAVYHPDASRPVAWTQREGASEPAVEGRRFLHARMRLDDPAYHPRITCVLLA